MRIGYLMGLACLSGAVALGGTRDYLKKPDTWFGGDDAARIAENILSWQADAGGWPKNVDVTGGPYTGDRKKLRGTFDNGATTDELRFLARMYDETGDERFKMAFKRGFDHILDAQYPTGGWPQFYPPGSQYHRHITFNDGAMVRLLVLLRETIEDERFSFLDRRRKKTAEQAFKKGIACILKCQIVTEEKRTAWCAQHDEINFEPRPARSYELVSVSGSESVGIVRLLMSLEEPGEDVIQAVDAAVAWFREVKLEGIRVEKRDGNKVVVEDEEAPPLWARFYEIGTNEPIFCDRDGIAKYRLGDIGHERRNGYRWLGNWPQRLLDKDYPEWKERIE